MHPAPLPAIPSGDPKLVLAGKFNLYETPEGGVHLSLLVDGDEEARHFEIPAMLLKMAGGGQLNKLLGIGG